MDKTCRPQVRVVCVGVWEGGACRAVPQELAVEDFDAVAVVQPLVLPDSHLQPDASTCTYTHARATRRMRQRARACHVRLRTCMHGTRTAHAGLRIVCRLPRIVCIGARQLAVDEGAILREVVEPRLARGLALAGGEVRRRGRSRPHLSLIHI